MNRRFDWDEFESAKWLININDWLSSRFGWITSSVRLLNIQKLSILALNMVACDEHAFKLIRKIWTNVIFEFYIQKNFDCYVVIRRIVTVSAISSDKYGPKVTYYDSTFQPESSSYKNTDFSWSSSVRFSIKYQQTPTIKRINEFCTYHRLFCCMHFISTAWLPWFQISLWSIWKSFSSTSCYHEKDLED